MSQTNTVNAVGLRMTMSARSEHDLIKRRYGRIAAPFDVFFIRIDRRLGPEASYHYLNPLKSKAADRLKTDAGEDSQEGGLWDR